MGTTEMIHPPENLGDDAAPRSVSSLSPLGGHLGRGVGVRGLPAEEYRAPAAASRDLDLTLDYHPRRQFVPFHDRAQRFACIVTHRRAGKTVACIQDLQVLRPGPVHDWTSHAADTFRYLAMTLDRRAAPNGFYRRIEYSQPGLA
jgi:hypothetical protein